VSKHSAQINKLMRSGKAQMEFSMTGRLPNVIEAKSPLITYLMGMPYRDRERLKNIQIGPAVGYSSRQSFPNAQVLLNWLRPSDYMSHTWPAEACRIKSFTRPVTSDMFASCQSQDHPLRSLKP
jgi:hypothetical protein